MKDGLDVQYFRYPGALVLQGRSLTPPKIYIEVSRPNGHFLSHDGMGKAQQIIETLWIAPTFNDKARSAVVAYRTEEKSVPPGCLQCPIHLIASAGARRVCQGLDENNVALDRPPVISRNTAGVISLRTIYSCKGHGTLGLSRRQRNRLDKITYDSLDAQLALLPQASCVLLPELP